MPIIVHSRGSAVAKRRNLKKEKAQRNRAYARQFRQKTSNSSRYKRYNNGGNDEQSDDQSQNNKDQE
ncbi:MAG: hypothetical protein AB4058_05290 [Microcystaceae cyanobacterium]